MSATYGPCVRCGVQTMYSARAPELCADCRRSQAALEKLLKANTAAIQAAKTGNRKARRAAKKLGKGGGE